MACGDGAALVAWMGPRGGRKLVAETPSAAHALAVVLAEPLVPLLVAPARGWDLDAPERAHVGGELLGWPCPRYARAAAGAGRYHGRARVEPPPLRQQGVALPRGVSLARALAQVRPSPWAQVAGKGRAA